MAPPQLSPRACTLLGQLQRQCLISQQLLASTRLTSRQTRHKTVRTALGRIIEDTAFPVDKSNPRPAIERYGKKEKGYTPKPLKQPIGTDRPPRPGDNSGVDYRSFRQRGIDLVNREKNTERRQALLREGARPAYLDWHNLGFAKGKLWVAPDRLFRADKALYFPNLHGKTLDSPYDGRDTTSRFAGRISVVSVYSGEWARANTATFTEGNRELQDMLAQGRRGSTPLQKVDINIEERFLRALLLRMFTYNLRRIVPKEDHGRYFIIKKGFTPSIKDSIGFLNRAIGYTYLVDEECRIRWAASADAEPGEAVSLARLTAKLIHDYRRNLGEQHWKANGYDPQALLPIPRPVQPVQLSAEVPTEATSEATAAGGRMEKDSPA